MAEVLERQGHDLVERRLGQHRGEDLVCLAAHVVGRRQHPARQLARAVHLRAVEPAIGLRRLALLEDVGHELAEQRPQLAQLVRLGHRRPTRAGDGRADARQRLRRADARQGRGRGAGARQLGRRGLRRRGSVEAELLTAPRATDLLARSRHRHGLAAARALHLAGEGLLRRLQLEHELLARLPLGQRPGRRVEAELLTALRAPHLLARRRHIHQRAATGAAHLPTRALADRLRVRRGRLLGTGVRGPVEAELLTALAAVDLLARGRHVHHRAAARAAHLPDRRLGVAAILVRQVEHERRLGLPVALVARGRVEAELLPARAVDLLARRRDIHHAAAARAFHRAVGHLALSGIRVERPQPAAAGPFYAAPARKSRRRRRPHARPGAGPASRRRQPILRSLTSRRKECPTRTCGTGFRPVDD